MNEHKKEDVVNYFIRHDNRILCLLKKIDETEKCISGHAKKAQDEISIQDKIERKIFKQKANDSFGIRNLSSGMQEMEANEQIKKKSKNVFLILLFIVVIALIFLKYCL